MAEKQNIFPMERGLGQHLHCVPAVHPLLGPVAHLCFSAQRQALVRHLLLVARDQRVIM